MFTYLNSGAGEPFSESRVVNFSPFCARALSVSSALCLWPRLLGQHSPSKANSAFRANKRTALATWANSASFGFRTPSCLQQAAGWGTWAGAGGVRGCPEAGGACPGPGQRGAGGGERSRAYRAGLLRARDGSCSRSRTKIIAQEVSQPIPWRFTCGFAGAANPGAAFMGKTDHQAQVPSPPCPSTESLSSMFYKYWHNTVLTMHPQR